MKSYEIIGYTYDADVHCIDCAIKFVQTKYELAPDQMRHSQYVGFVGWKEDVWQTTEYEDSEGNTLHPIFVDNYADMVYEDEDGKQYPPRCGDCGEELL